MNTDFPEEIFPISNNNKANYEYIVQQGFNIAQNKSILFCGICRNVEDVLQLNIDRITRTGSMFKDYHIFVYENDSNDNTLKILQDNQSDKLTFLSETRDDRNYAEQLDTPLDPWHYNRCCVLAECRNKYLEFLQKLETKPDYVCVIDLDIKGGWSYNGFAHSLFMIEQEKDTGCVSAYGVLADPTGKDPLEQHSTSNFLMYDSFAFRPYGWNSAIHMISTPLFNRVLLNKDMEPFTVESNFGGMAIYKSKAILDGEKYEAKNWVSHKSPFVDPDHVNLHRNMQKKNWKILINPAFIVSYSHHKFSQHKGRTNVSHVSH